MVYVHEVLCAGCSMHRMLSAGSSICRMLSAQAVLCVGCFVQDVQYVGWYLLLCLTRSPIRQTWWPQRRILSPRYWRSLESWGGLSWRAIVSLGACVYTLEQIWLDISIKLTAQWLRSQTPQRGIMTHNSGGNTMDGDRGLWLNLQSVDVLEWWKYILA